MIFKETPQVKDLENDFSFFYNVPFYHKITVPKHTAAKIN